MKYEIYQMKNHPRYVYLRFEGFEKNQKALKSGLSLLMYDKVYEGNLFMDWPDKELLESLYEKFNCYPPTDFEGHSLSVSDVIILEKENGTRTQYYCDTIGFKECQL